MIGLRMARVRGLLSDRRFNELLFSLEEIPTKVEAALGYNDKIKELATGYMGASNFIYLGRGYNFPVALEGALKLKEISYIHAEGYPAAEMKHGPIALVDKDMPVIFLATRDSTYEKIIANIQEVRARQGKIIAIVTEGDTHIPTMVDHYIEIPPVEESFYPLLTVIPLQLLAYHIAVMRGCDVDQPRNLAKSVTVE
jgi:glucosamine--fructose-6-phosphate aminotransferase (isomerizing)